MLKPVSMYLTMHALDLYLTMRVQCACICMLTKLYVPEQSRRVSQLGVQHL